MHLESKYNQLYGYTLGVLNGILMWECVSPELYEKLVNVKNIIEEGYKL